jgi:hypothetical protein
VSFLVSLYYFLPPKTQAKLKLIQAWWETPSGGGLFLFFAEIPIKRNKLDKKGNKPGGGLQVVGVVPFFAEIPTKGTS